MRVLFAGTPEFAVPALEALLTKHTIVGVYTQPDRRSGRGKKISMSPIKTLALRHNLVVHQPETLADQGDTIKQLEPDVFVVVAFGMLLPQSILDIPRLGCVNIHGSILPRWRGAAPIQRAIEAGDSETGVSIMRMEAGLDTGPVYQILKTDITLQDTSQTLHDTLAQLGAQGICDTLKAMENSLDRGQAAVQAVAQNDQQATYAKKISKQEAQINWQENAEVIQRKIRAFNPWPICQTMHNGARIRLWQSSLTTIDSTDHPPRPGQVIEASNDGVIIACGSTAQALKLEVLQRDGSKALPCRDFLNGYPILPGDMLS